MKDEICSEQLMPKNFKFYNPDHHKKIYSLVEENNLQQLLQLLYFPVTVGVLYPFPLFNDGDFKIRSALALIKPVMR